MAMISMLIGLLTAFFVYNDAKKRGHGVIMLLLWSIGSALFPYIMIPIYLLFGRKAKEQDTYNEHYEHYDNEIIDIEATVVEETINCTKCGNEINEELLTCPYCQEPTGAGKKDD